MFSNQTPQQIIASANELRATAEYGIKYYAATFRGPILLRMINTHVGRTITQYLSLTLRAGGTKDLTPAQLAASYNSFLTKQLEAILGKPKQTNENSAAKEDISQRIQKQLQTIRQAFPNKKNQGPKITASVQATLDQIVEGSLKNEKQDYYSSTNQNSYEIILNLAILNMIAIQVVKNKTPHNITKKQKERAHTFGSLLQLNLRSMQTVTELSMKTQMLKEYEKTIDLFAEAEAQDPATTPSKPPSKPQPVDDAAKAKKKKKKRRKVKLSLAAMLSQTPKTESYCIEVNGSNLNENLVIKKMGVDDFLEIRLNRKKGDNNQSLATKHGALMPQYLAHLEKIAQLKKEHGMDVTMKTVASHLQTARYYAATLKKHPDWINEGLQSLATNLEEQAKENILACFESAQTQIKELTLEPIALLKQMNLAMTELTPLLPKAYLERLAQRIQKLKVSVITQYASFIAQHKNFHTQTQQFLDLTKKETDLASEALKQSRRQLIIRLNTAIPWDSELSAKLAIYKSLALQGCNKKTRAQLQALEVTADFTSPIYKTLEQLHPWVLEKLTTTYKNGTLTVSLNSGDQLITWAICQANPKAVIDITKKIATIYPALQKNLSFLSNIPPKRTTPLSETDFACIRGSRPRIDLFQLKYFLMTAHDCQAKIGIKGTLGLALAGLLLPCSRTFSDIDLVILVDKENRLIDKLKEKTQGRCGINTGLFTHTNKHNEQAAQSHSYTTGEKDGASKFDISIITGTPESYFQSASCQLSFGAVTWLKQDDNGSVMIDYVSRFCANNDPFDYIPRLSSDYTDALRTAKERFAAVIHLLKSSIATDSSGLTRQSIALMTEKIDTTELNQVHISNTLFKLIPCVRRILQNHHPDFYSKLTDRFESKGSLFGNPPEGNEAKTEQYELPVSNP